jgi:hypothetical protein
MLKFLPLVDYTRNNFEIRRNQTSFAFFVTCLFHFCEQCSKKDLFSHNHKSRFDPNHPLDPNHPQIKV